MQGVFWMLWNKFWWKVVGVFTVQTWFTVGCVIMTCRFWGYDHVRHHGGFGHQSPRTALSNRLLAKCLSRHRAVFGGIWLCKTARQCLFWRWWSWAVTCVTAVQKPAQQYTWLDKCLTDIRMLRIEEFNDLMPAIKKLRRNRKRLRLVAWLKLVSSWANMICPHFAIYPTNHPQYPWLIKPIKISSLSPWQKL